MCRLASGTEHWVFFSFYLQGVFTEGRKYGIPFEWLKIGLVFIGLNYLPLNSSTLVTLQIYLVVSVFSLLWLTVYTATDRKPAQRNLNSTALLARANDSAEY